MNNLLLVAILFSAFYGYSYTTYVPDNNFEQALIDLGYDDVLDNYVITANINTRTELVLESLEIVDLTGIEDFVSLTDLNISNNEIVSLNVSQNTSLTYLNANGNWNLEGFNISQNNLLEHLDLGETSVGIIGMDFSQNLALTYLDINFSYFIDIDISLNTALTYFDTSFNDSTSLDLSQNTALTYIDTNFNYLTSLDVKNGNNHHVTYFDSSWNGDGTENLTCISVDDASYSTTNWTYIDAQSSFSEDCSLGVDDFELSQAQLYPNPVSKLTIKSSVTIEKIDIYDALGKQVMTSSETQLDVSGLALGIYIVKIKSENGNAVKKFIKK